MPFEGPDVKWEKLINERDEAAAKAKAAAIYVMVVIKVTSVLAVLAWRHLMLPSFLSLLLLNLPGLYDELLIVSGVVWWIGPQVPLPRPRALASRPHALTPHPSLASASLPRIAPDHTPPHLSRRAPSLTHTNRLATLAGRHVLDEALLHHVGAAAAAQAPRRTSRLCGHRPDRRRHQVCQKVGCRRSLLTFTADLARSSFTADVVAPSPHSRLTWPPPLLLHRWAAKAGVGEASKKKKE